MMKQLTKMLQEQKGLTLVELLVVMVLLALISGIAGTILIVALRSDAKAQTGTTVRQSGNYIIAQFNDTVRTAYGFAGVSSIVSSSSSDYTLDCPTAGGNYQSVAFYSDANHFINKTADEVYSCHGGNDVRYGTSISSQNSILPGVVKIDTSGTCQITCSQTNGNPPTIGISFTLDYNSSSTFSENKAIFPFASTTGMRNSNQVLPN